MRFSKTVSFRRQLAFCLPTTISRSPKQYGGWDRRKPKEVSLMDRSWYDLIWTVTTARCAFWIVCLLSCVWKIIFFFLIKKKKEYECEVNEEGFFVYRCWGKNTEKTRQWDWNSDYSDGPRQLSKLAILGWMTVRDVSSKCSMTFFFFFFCLWWIHISVCAFYKYCINCDP